MNWRNGLYLYSYCILWNKLVAYGVTSYKDDHFSKGEDGTVVLLHLHIYFHVHWLNFTFYNKLILLAEYLGTRD